MSESAPTGIAEPRYKVGQVYDTGGGALAYISEMDKGCGGAAHFVWLDRRLDQWWTKRLIPNWKLHEEHDWSDWEVVPSNMGSRHQRTCRGCRTTDYD
jgi:hypothetical protein